MITDVLLVILGGILAAGTGWILDRSRERATLIKTRELFIVGLCDDLRNSIELFDKIKDEWVKTSIIWFVTLNELKESRQFYQNSRNFLILIEDSELRKKVSRYYFNSSNLINLLEFQQNRVIYIFDKLNDLIRDIRNENPELQYENALEYAKPYLPKELQEFEIIQKNVPNNIASLADFKTQALDILRSLESIKI